VKKIGYIIITLFWPVICFSQEASLPETLYSIAEELAENQTDEEATVLFVEKLQELAERPVHINSADETELSRLFFLTDFQVKALSDYVKKNGKIVSVFEVANVPGFGREVAEMIVPFIVLETEEASGQTTSKTKNIATTNFSRKWPCSLNDQVGPPWKVMTRYKFSCGNFTGGVAAEKDNGEKLLTGKPPLPDFFSANMAWNGSGTIKKIILGDYGGKFGLGTGLNTGLGTGLSITSSGVISGSDELTPYSSINECVFLRGAAVKLQVKKTKIFLFGSLKRIDATTDSTGGPGNVTIKTFNRTGLHNTSSLLSRKDIASETACGFAVSSDFNKIRIGILWSSLWFSLKAGSYPVKPEDLYDFRGLSYHLASFYYKAVFGKAMFAAEFSTGINEQTAFVQAFSFKPADRLSISLLYRHYDPGFISFHGKGPFSSSAGDNLSGLAGSFAFEAAKHLFIKAGCDVRYYPWVKYRCGAPSISKAGEIRLQYVPDNKIISEVSYNYRFSMLDNAESQGIKKQYETISRTFKVTFRYSFNGNLTTGLRADIRFTEPGEGNGVMLLQDITYRSGHLPLTIWFRYSIFKTDDWNSRLYTYENDLLSSFSVPSLSGTGTRTYIMADWKFGKVADLRIKYAVTGLLNENYQTSETEELRVQLRLNF
jgi:hypothetical protein